MLLGRRYNRVKKRVGAPTENKNAEKQIRQIDGIVSAVVDNSKQQKSPTPPVSPAPIAPAPTVSTSATLAVQHGVSARTVERAGKFAAEVEKDARLQEAVAQNVPVIKVMRQINPEMTLNLTDGQGHRAGWGLVIQRSADGVSF
ncbi:MAG: hypothetical protein H7834_16355 [Magnetococcus sp. YQC-9]